MPAVATTAQAPDPAQAATPSARTGDADPDRFARLLDTAQGNAWGQPSTDPAAAANFNRRTATPEQAPPSDKPAAGKPATGKPATGKPAAGKPTVGRPAVPDAQQASGPAEDAAQGKQALPRAPAQNGATAAAAPPAEQQAPPHPAAGQGKAEPVPPAAPAVKPGVVLVQPLGGAAQGKLSVPGQLTEAAQGKVSVRGQLAEAAQGKLSVPGQPAEAAQGKASVPGPAVPGSPARSGEGQQARTARPVPEPAASAHLDTTQGQDSAASVTLGASPNAASAAPASADPGTSASAEPGTSAPGPDATAPADASSTPPSMRAEAASGAGKLALPSDPGIGRPVGPDQSDASKPDDAAPELPAVAMADGVPQQVSLATTTDPVVTGAMLPRVAGEAGEPVAIRIARAARDGDKSLTLELHPADLGRVEVRLSFHADGVGVQMTLDKPETFEAFSRNRAGLEQQLAQAGIDLGGGGLDLRLGQQDGQPESERRPANLRTQAGSGAISVAALPQAIRWAAQGLVDIVA